MDFRDISLSSKRLEAPCWQLLSPHDLARSDAATVDEAWANRESFTNGNFRKNFEAYPPVNETNISHQTGSKEPNHRLKNVILIEPLGVGYVIVPRRVYKLDCSWKDERDSSGLLKHRLSVFIVWKLFKWAERSADRCWSVREYPTPGRCWWDCEPGERLPVRSSKNQRISKLSSKLP